MPWLGPRGRGSRNEPATVLRIVAELSRLRNEAREEVVAQVATAYRGLIRT